MFGKLSENYGMYAYREEVHGKRTIIQPCLILELLPFVLFSSPDHEVFKVRYSDGAMPGSFVVNNWVVNILAVTVLIGSSSNFVRMFVSMKYRSSSKMGHLGSNTTSQELNIEKAC
jgi:hypothetical protein